MAEDMEALVRRAGDIVGRDLCALHIPTRVD